MSIKIHFTPKAEKQLSMVSNLETVKTGFASGLEIGKHIVIEDLLNVDFDKQNIDKVYVEVLDKMGEKLIGPFFKKGKFFDSEWFIGDVVIKIGDKKNESFLYEKKD